MNVNDELVDFSLENVESTYTPAKLDRIILTCKMDEESNTITEVLRIVHPPTKRITGRITQLIPELHGVIDDKCIILWNVLGDLGIELHPNDSVTADCIECEVIGIGDYGLRCLNLTLNDINADGKLCNTRLELELANKHGIEITENVSVELDGINQTREVTMTVKNASSVNIDVVKSRFIRKSKYSQLTLISPTQTSNFRLKHGETKVYKFNATAKYFGHANEQFAITFSGESTGDFVITRFIKVCVHDRDGKHNMIGTGRNILTNRGYTHEVMTRDMDIISPGNREPNFVAMEFDEWKIPKELRDIVLRHASSRCFIFDELDKKYPHLNETLALNNYGQVYHDLLYLEECEMHHNIRKYDRISRFMREKVGDKDLLVLAVENVAETRPSLVLGDYIIASDPRAKDNASESREGRKGYICEVRQNKILLEFDDGFQTNYKDEEYKVVFHFSRRNLQKQHHAIELVKTLLPSVLFPGEVQTIKKQVDVTLDVNSGVLQCGDSTLPWFNDTLNIIQKKAVTDILQGVARPSPYVIFGPPG